VKLQSLRSSRLGAGVAAAALIGAAVLVPASTANAEDTVTIGWLYCASWGSGQFICTMTILGGVTPYMTYWTAGANVSSFTAQGIEYATGYCGVQGQNTEVSVFVRDDMGATSQASFEFTCE
jgi:hypothetical protein